MNKIEDFKQVFNQLTSDYIDSYKGRQPILTIINSEGVFVQPEFLNHLPLSVKLIIERKVFEINNGISK